MEYLWQMEIIQLIWESNILMEVKDGPYEPTGEEDILAL